MKKEKISDYTPLIGFYDLRAFNIPDNEFRKLWNVQRFLFEVESQRKSGKVHPQINAIRDLSAQYQQLLFQFQVLKPELL